MADMIPLVLMIALMGGVAWVGLVAIPRWRRQRAQRYLDIMDDPMTDRVQTGRRTETRRRGGTKHEVVVYATASSQLDAPWRDLSCTLLSSSDPRDPDALIVEDPHEIRKMACTVGNTTARETLAGDRALQRTLHAFLVRSEKNTIRTGEVRVEILDSECDALTLTGMQTDVADILHALGQQAPPS